MGIRINTDDLLNVLAQEIQWSKDHINDPDMGLNKEFAKGFIDGLEQAKYIIKKLEGNKNCSSSCG